MTRRNENRRLFPVVVAAALILMALVVIINRERFLAGVNDFAQLYAGATLVGTPGLYQPEANKRVHREAIGVEVISVYYSRPPFYALILKPLALLPYQTAYWIFQCVSLACIGWFLWTFGRRHIETVLFACIYPPLIIVLLQGQDVGIVVALASAGYLLMRKDRQFEAGLVWSLCAIKPHLLVFLPAALLFSRKWRALAGGVAGGVVLTALCYLAQGPHWISEYATLLSDAVIHPEPDNMPNLQAVQAAFAGAIPGRWIGPATAAAAALSLVAVWRVKDWALRFAVALPAAILVSYHAYAQDTLLLLLTLVLVLEHQAEPPMVRFAALAVTPVASILLLMGSPWSALYPAYLLVWIAYAALARSAPPGQNQTKSTAGA